MASEAAPLIDRFGRHISYRQVDTWSLPAAPMIYE